MYSVVTHETKLSIFQFKTLHNILPTNLHLYRMNIHDSSSCPICNDSTQTIEHMFITCSSAIEFWNQFYKWYTFEPLSRFTNTEILYGIIRNNSIETTLNQIILIAKYHIYCNATSNANLDFVAFLERLKNTIETEKYIAYTSHASEEFSKKWRRMKLDLFNSSLITLLYRKKRVKI